MKASRGLSVDLAQDDLEPRELVERLAAPTSRHSVKAARIELSRRAS